MATNTKSSSNLMKGKASVGGGPSSSSSKPRIDSSSASKKKVVEGSIKNSASDSKNRSIASSSTTIKKTLSTSQSKTTTKTVKRTREKKVYSLPGQKYDTPEEREPLRIFYESLSKQIPSSEMAEFWMMEHGLLSPEKARKALEKKQRNQKQLRTGTPIKSPSNKPESSKKPPPVPKNGEVKAKKRIVEDSDSDDDFVLSHKRRKG